MTDSHDTQIIYTDGACSNNGQRGASAGIGVHWPKHPHLSISESIDGQQTNQRAEIIAATKGITLVRDNGYKSVLVRADSHYVIKAATKWIPNWNINGWNNVKNHSEFRDLEKAMAKIDVKFEYVPSANNAADSLARQGAKKVGLSNSKQLLTLASLCRKIKL